MTTSTYTGITADTAWRITKPQGCTLESPPEIPGGTPQILFPRHPRAIFSEKATPGIPRKIPGVPGTPPTQNFCCEKTLSRNCKIYFTYPERFFNFFPRGFPRRRAFPGRIHGEYGENTGLRRDIPGIYPGFPGGALSPCKYTCPNMPYGHPI